MPTLGTPSITAHLRRGAVLRLDRLDLERQRALELRREIIIRLAAGFGATFGMPRSHGSLVGLAVSAGFGHERTAAITAGNAREDAGALPLLEEVHSLLQRVEAEVVRVELDRDAEHHQVQRARVHRVRAADVELRAAERREGVGVETAGRGVRVRGAPRVAVVDRADAALRHADSASKTISAASLSIGSASSSAAVAPTDAAIASSVNGSSPTFSECTHR